jgi:hypothetical protein
MISPICFSIIAKNQKRRRRTLKLPRYDIWL